MIEEILIKLGVDASTVASGMRTVVSSMGSYGQAIKDAFTNPLGAVKDMLSGLAAQLKSTFDDLQQRAIDTKKFAELANLSQSAAQPLVLAAQGAGVDPDAIAKSMLKVAEAMEKVKKGKEGGADALKSFSELGVTLDDLKTKNYQQIWFAIATAMHEATISQTQLVAGFEVMGKGFETLVPLFKRGPNNPVDQMKTQSDEDLKKLQQMDKDWKIKKGILSSFWENIVGGVMNAGDFGGKDGKEDPGWLKTIRNKIGFDNLSDAGMGDIHARSMQERVSEQEAAKSKRAADAEIARLAAAEKAKKEHPEAERMTKEAQSLEEKHAEKILPLAQELARLQLVRNHLLGEMNDAGDSELQTAEKRKHLAENQLSIDEKTLSVRDKTKAIQDEIDDAQRTHSRNQFDLAHVGNINPTIAELAGPGARDWMGQAQARVGRRNPFQWEARRIEFLKADEFEARAKGNTDWAEGDKKERQGREKYLSDLGVTAPDTALRNIQEATQKSQIALDRLVDKAEKDGFKVIPVNAE